MRHLGSLLCLASILASTLLSSGCQRDYSAGEYRTAYRKLAVCELAIQGGRLSVMYASPLYLATLEADSSATVSSLNRTKNGMEETYTFQMSLRPETNESATDENKTENRGAMSIFSPNAPKISSNHVLLRTADGRRISPKSFTEYPGFGPVPQFRYLIVFPSSKSGSKIVLEECEFIVEGLGSVPLKSIAQVSLHT